jgi:hypothetical protein
VGPVVLSVDVLSPPCSVPLEPTAATTAVLATLS